MADQGRVAFTSTGTARAYFAVQAAAGALWWVAVFASDDVARWTLGGLEPELLVGPDLVLFAGVVLFVLGSAGGLWSCVTMALQGKGTPLPAETARELVVAGPYRIVRNPMAVCGAAQTVGVGLVLGSWTVVAIGVAGAVLWNVVIRPGEEADLAERFGASYQRYRAEVRCWIPVRRAGAAG